MAIPVKIDDLINARNVESTRIEYKKGFNPEPIIRSICAFANDIDNVGGGYIIIGIEEDKGTPKFPVAGVPQKEIDGILKELRQYCHTIEPLYEPVVEPVLYHDKTDDQDKHIIVIWITGGYGRPYKAPSDATKKGSPKYYYIRKFSSSVQASQNEEKELFYVSSDIPFDDRENLRADISDLDIGLLRNHLKETGSDLYQYSLSKDTLEIARDMHLISGPEENLKPLNVGILMFSEKIEDYFRYARIEVVDIPDPTGTNMVEKVFTGPIQRQLKDALSYIKNYVIKDVIIKEKDKAESVRISNYPYAAVEELLSNAVYHRSYQINEPITVRITPKNMEITSFPGFDRSITDKDIANYELRARIYRNRRIGDFLKELKLIEGRNTGFPNAFKALKDNGSSLPEFKMNPERDYLSVIIPVQDYFLPKDKKSLKASDYEEKIIELVSKKSMTLTEISRAMDYKSISKKLSSTVELLVEKGTLELVTEGSSMKYRVTSEK